MKRILFFALLCISIQTTKAQTGIGTNTPNAQAILDVKSDNKGVLLPRISLTNSSTFIDGAATNDHNSMMVFNTNPSTSGTGLSGIGFYYWGGGASGNWIRVGELPKGSKTGNLLTWDGNNWIETRPTTSYQIAGVSGVTEVSLGVQVYSLRKLISDYNGPAFEVRRTSDSNTQDIGFTDNGDLDTASLLSFVGSSTGVLSKWYDQGNPLGTNTVTSVLIQTNTNDQPAIVLNGVLLTNSYNKPVLRFDTAEFNWTGFNIISGTDYSIFVAGDVANSSGQQYFINTYPQFTNQALHVGFRNNTLATFAQYANDVDVAIASTASQSYGIYYSNLDTASGKTVKWNSYQASDNVTNVLNPSYGRVGQCNRCDIYEVIVTSFATSDGSSAAMTTNMNNYWFRE